MRGVGFSINREVGRLHRGLGAALGILVLGVSAGWLLTRHAGMPGGVDAVRSLVSPEVSVLLVDPVRPQQQWLGTSQGVLRSQDGGLHWQSVSLGASGGGVRALVLDGRLPGLMYGLTQASHVWRSDDGGAHWRWIPGPRRVRSGDRLLSLQMGPKGHLLVLGEAGVYQRLDAGWQYRAHPVLASGAVSPWVAFIRPYLRGESGARVLDGLAGLAVVLVLSGYGLFVMRLLRARAARRRSLAVFQQQQASGTLVFRFPARSPFLD